MADQDGSDKLINLLKNGTRSAIPQHTGVKRKEIEWIDQVETMIEPIRMNLAVYAKTLFKGTLNQTTFYN